MECSRKEHRRILPGKIIIAVIVVAVIALIAGILIHEHRKSVDKLAAQAAAVDAFNYGGETYTLESAVKNQTERLRVLRPVSNREDYLFLPGEDALWADAVGRFVYTDGEKVKTCDINGRNAETIFQASGSRYSVVLRDVMDDYAVAESAHDLGGGEIQLTGDYFLINLVTGNVTEMTVNPSRGVVSFCIADGFLYYGTSDIGISGVNAQASDMYCDICRCNLETGECEILTDEITLSCEENGCVTDGYLYFMYSPYGPAARIPVDGGDAEELNLGLDSVSRIVGYGGKVLAACENQEDDGTYLTKIFAFDPAAGELGELFRWTEEEDSLIVKLRVQDDTLIVCRENGAVFQGKLA